MGKFDSVFTDTRVLAKSAVQTATQRYPQTNDNSRGCFVVVDVTETTPAVNEVQTLSVDATGGTYTLTFGANTTSALAYNADAATVESALRGLPSVGGNNVNVAPSGPDKSITFVGTLAAQNVAQITADSSQLTGNSHTASVVTTTQGNPGTSVVPSVGGYDDAMGKDYGIISGAAITSPGTVVLRIYPGLTPIANQTVSDCLPQKFQVIMTPANPAPTTYSVGLHMIA